MVRWATRVVATRAVVGVVSAVAVVSVVSAMTGCSSSTTTGQGSAAVTSPTSTGTPDFPSAPPSSASLSRSLTASAPPSASTTASTRPATPPPPSRAGALPAGFVGAWYGHGRSLVVRPDGGVSVDFRTYVQCTATVTTGCDRIVGSVLHDGGHVTGRVTQVRNATTVTVTVSATTVPTIVPVGSFRLGHDLKHHAVAPFGNKLNGVPFCGAGSPTGYCGA